MTDWQPIETAPRDGTPVLLFTTCHGMVEAWFCQGGWSEATPNGPAEYDGSAWVCADDAFQVEVEECDPDPVWWLHGTATHWMPLPEPPKKEKDDE